MRPSRWSLLVCLVGLTLGCVRFAPYERGALAHPSMKPDHARSVVRDHTYAIAEGAAPKDSKPGQQQK